jgi:hypothetical protein
MDQRERINDFEEGLRAAIQGALADLWTAGPAIIQSFDPVFGTCTALLSIAAQIRDKDGKITQVAIPLLRDVPVIFPSAGGFCLTFPIKVGDEVLIVFGQRCIDGWWQQGGIQAQAELRMHDLSDGFAIPGPWSKPKVPSGISTTAVQLRTNDGTAKIELTADGKVNIIAPGGVHVTGTLGASGEITANSTHTVSAHTHSDPQGGSTGGPVG